MFFFNRYISNELTELDRNDETPLNLRHFAYYNG